MPFTQIDDAPLRAQNLSETGAVYYLRWHDMNKEVYIQITDVVGGKGNGNGTYSNYLYPLNDIGQRRYYSGYDISDGSKRVTSDNNMSGFLRAVRNDIIRRTNEQTKSNIL